jgi:hypothetical protein
LARITSSPEEVIFHGEEEGREEEGHEEEGREEEEVTGIWTWHVLRGELAQCRPPLFLYERRRENEGSNDVHRFGIPSVARGRSPAAARGRLVKWCRGK